MTSARSSVPPFHAMEMAGLATAREATGASVIHLEVGQPWSPAPAAVLAAAARALERDRIGYTNASGLLSLRKRIAGHYQDWYGVELDPAALVITAGASAGFTLAFLACFDPGDRVGVVEPGYPCYRNTLLALGRRARRHRRRARVPLGADARAARPRRTARRAGRRQPVEPDRHGPRPRAAGRGGRLVPRPRRPADLRRDLPRHHLRPAGRERARRCRATPSWCPASPSTSR